MCVRDLQGRVLLSLPGVANRATFTPDGRAILVGGQSVELIDAEDGGLLRSFDERPRTAWAVAVSGDGERFLD